MLRQGDAWPTQAVLRWLQDILCERFGHQISIQETAPRVLRLSVPGAASVIEQTVDSDRFTSEASELPCCPWAATAEGWTAPLDQPLPAPGVASLPSPLIEQTKPGYRIHYDILGLTYWMLSRQEEVGRTDVDNHGRFPATASHAFKHGYLERPIVDEWLDILGQVIQRLWPRLERKPHRFGMRVSHDVDGPSRFGFAKSMQVLRSMAGDLIKRRDLGNFALAPWVRLQSGKQFHPADPYNSFDWIMNLSERHGLTSAFYFICGRTDPTKDAAYEPEHPAIRDLMRGIHVRGHEIGLHPSYNTYQSPTVIVGEAHRLRKVCEEEGIRQSDWGGRMHFLRWEHPTTMYGWEAAGMAYDSTLSYADRPGFRCGTCFEYPAFDPVAGKALNLRIRPLVAMECTVMAERYMGLGTGEAAYDKFRQLKDSCRAVNGCFTLLWHNSQFTTNAERELYQAVLAS